MNKRDYQPGEAYAAASDLADPIREYRNRFNFPNFSDGRELIYFTGNSLGLQPKTAREYIDQELDDWARFAVEGHIRARHPWLPYHEFVTEPMARVIGARPIETIVMNSLTVNLHLMLVSFYRPEGRRKKIAIEKGAFPSDQYAVKSQLRFHGVEPEEGLIELSPRDCESTLRTEDRVETIGKNGDEVALVLLGGVNYYTGQAFDLPAITEAGHKAGAIVGFDLAHAAGNLQLHLHDWDVDFAVWCSYKYLNAGPGGIAGAFVHERHANSFDLPRFVGWWGHNKRTRFLMGPEFDPLPGAEGWQLSNPPIFQLAALRASLEIFDDAGMSNLRAKSEALTGYLVYLLNQIDDDRISIITPRDPAHRGCQLSIRVKDSDKLLFDAITDRGVIADWREPDVIRVAPTPLYNSYTEVFRFSTILEECLR